MNLWKRYLTLPLVLASLLSAACAAPPPEDQTEPEGVASVISDSADRLTEVIGGSGIPDVLEQPSGEDGQPVEFVYDPMSQTAPPFFSLYTEGETSDSTIPFPVGCETYGEALAACNPTIKALYDTMEAFFAEENRDNWELESRTFTYAGASEPTTASGLVCAYGYPEGVSDYKTFGNYIYAAYSAYDNDHPYESAGLTGRLVYLYSKDAAGNRNGYEVLFWLYDDDLEKYKTKRAELSAAADAFMEQFNRDDIRSADTLSQYRYIHDFLSAACHYNYPALEWDSSTEKYKNAHNAYGALVGGQDCDKGAVVCQGYTDAYLLLCQRVGLPGVVVYGRTGSDWSESHIWNDILLNGEWYAVDLTWNDVDNTLNKNLNSTYYIGTVDYSCTKYQYFGDNRYFLEGYTDTYDHNTSSQYFYSGSLWTFEAPSLADTGSDSGWLNEEMQVESITVHLNEREGGAPQLYDPMLFLLHTSYKSVPNVELTVPDGTEFCRAYRNYHLYAIAEGRSFTIRGENGNAAITRLADDTESGSCFEIAAGGALTLEDLTIDGNGGNFTASAPLLSAHGMLTLKDVTVQNHNGAYGVSIDTGGNFLMDGNCVIENNSADGSAANIYFAAESQLTLGPDFSGYVGISAAAEVSALAGNVPSAIESCFFSDETEYAILVQNDTLLRRQFLHSDTTMAASFVYPENVGIAALRGRSLVTLADPNGKAATVLAAAYSDAGQLLWADACAVDASGVITLPNDVQGATFYTLFAIDSTGCPCAEQLSFSAT